MTTVGIRDVLAYAPVMHSCVAPSGRWVAAVIPRYDALAAGSPLKLHLLDLHRRGSWQALGHADATFHDPVWCPTGDRLAVFRRHGVVQDIAVFDPEDPSAPEAVQGMPHAATALKWWGEPARLACLGLDDQDCIRLYQWSDHRQPPVAVTPPLRKVGDHAHVRGGTRFAWLHTPPRVVGRPEPVSTLWVSPGPQVRGRAVALPEPALGFLAWSDDGRWLALLARPEGALLRAPRLWIVDPETGETRQLLTRVDGWITGFDWTPDGSLVVCVDQGICGRLLRVRCDGSHTTVGPTETCLSGAHVERAEGRILHLQQDGDDPQHLRLMDLQGVSRPISRFNRRMRERALRPLEEVRWDHDGLELQGLLMRTRPGPAPVLVWLHGGPAEHLERTFSAYFQWFSAQGWHVFAPNYRGSTGRDDAFLRSLIGRICEADVGDVRSGIDQLARMGVLEGERAAVMGWSYGATLALLTSAEDPRVRAVVAGAPVVDWLTVFGAVSWPAVTRRYFGADPWDDPARYDRASPIRRLGKAAVPTLLLHGADDVRVPVSQSRLLLRMLQSRGTPADLRIFPGQGHVLSAPHAVREMLVRAHAWILRHGAEDASTARGR